MTRRTDRRFVLNDVQDTDNFETILGIPQIEQTFYGIYSGKFPQVAASKAYTSVLNYMKKYGSEWYPKYRPDLPLLLLITEITESKNQERTHLYLGTRIEHKQGPRTIINTEDGRERYYRWSNKMIPIKYNDDTDAGNGNGNDGE